MFRPLKWFVRCVVVRVVDVVVVVVTVAFVVLVIVFILFIVVAMAAGVSCCWFYVVSLLLNFPCFSEFGVVVVHVFVYVALL